MLPLVPLAGFGGTGITDATHAEDKLVVLESQTAGHTGAGVGPPIRGTHWHKAVRTTTGKTCRVRGQKVNDLRHILLKTMSALTPKAYDPLTPTLALTR